MSQEPNPRDPAAPPLVFERSGGAASPLLLVRGEIDVATSPLLRSELSEVLALDPTEITLDFADVTFIDSSGLGVLVGALKRLRERDSARRFRILHAQEAVQKVFDITGLDGLFDLSD